MMTQQTLTQLRSLKLNGMADALQEQMAQPNMSALSFELDSAKFSNKLSRLSC
jgi:hypothetical protein